jgi:hypothetical protein
MLSIALDKTEAILMGSEVRKTRRYINLSNQPDNNQLPHKRKNRRGDCMIKNMLHMISGSNSLKNLTKIPTALEVILLNAEKHSMRSV